MLSVTLVYLSHDRSPTVGALVVADPDLDFACEPSHTQKSYQSSHMQGACLSRNVLIITWPIQLSPPTVGNDCIAANPKRPPACCVYVLVSHALQVASYAKN